MRLSDDDSDNSDGADDSAVDREGVGMVFQKLSETAQADVRPAGPARPSRHGRPKPLGGRFALPSLRFSGAAMAMSTVLGISAATTWLVTAQQHIGRRPGVSTVDASLPPLPNPEAAAAADTDARSTQQPSPPPSPRPAIGPTADSSENPGPRALGTPAAVVPPAPPPRTQAPVQAPTQAPVQVAHPVQAPAKPSTRPSTAPAPVSIPVSAPVSAPVSRPPVDGLAGKAVRDLLGPSGTRHNVTLRISEPLTALQVELRLARPEALPGTTPWSSLPDAVVTVTQERGTLVYRFTVPAGPDIQPGDYSFGVRGTRRAGTEGAAGGIGAAGGTGKAAQAQETWTASAFAPLRPRALAVRGTFN
ncbi:hypothetical protein [Kitasatospora sp. MAP5-34]|uniref:hypothetical protein n=1 Tax=Kitasatospora sp. MAP5-34 TaxID=3035102 RepID=UPI002476F59A|nr:hypothetical protein [Kitasatospora sp. MAP5-34]